MEKLYFLHIKPDGRIILTNPAVRRQKRSYSDKLCYKIIFSPLRFFSDIFFNYLIFFDLNEIRVSNCQHTLQINRLNSVKSLFINVNLIVFCLHQQKYRSIWVRYLCVSNTVALIFGNKDCIFTYSGRCQSELETSVGQRLHLTALRQVIVRVRLTSFGNINQKEIYKFHV